MFQHNRLRHIPVKRWQDVKALINFMPSGAQFKRFHVPCCRSDLDEGIKTGRPSFDFEQIHFAAQNGYHQKYVTSELFYTQLQSTAFAIVTPTTLMSAT